MELFVCSCHSLKKKIHTKFLLQSVKIFQKNDNTNFIRISFVFIIETESLKLLSSAPFQVSFYGIKNFKITKTA